MLPRRVPTFGAVRRRLVTQQSKFSGSGELFLQLQKQESPRLYRPRPGREDRSTVRVLCGWAQVGSSVLLSRWRCWFSAVRRCCSARSRQRRRNSSSLSVVCAMCRPGRSYSGNDERGGADHPPVTGRPMSNHSTEPMSGTKSTNSSHKGLGRCRTRCSSQQITSTSAPIHTTITSNPRYGTDALLYVDAP
uniref:Uncharacterized protein n=1 Tax=Rhodococcus sp. NS1 TaxID=402236 RepID=A0A097SQC6_9NOCA|nr:hypothetical protein LRS1606.295 [Rhodococcus sp. NS1]